MPVSQLYRWFEVPRTANAALEEALIARYGCLGRVPRPFLLRSDSGLIDGLISTLKEHCLHRARLETFAMPYPLAT